MRPEDQKLLEDLDWAADRGTAASMGLEEFILDIKARVEARLQDANDFEEAFDNVVGVVTKTLVANERLQTSTKRLIESLKK